jgi:nucleotide-binding universal stress UspA family protein
MSASRDARERAGHAFASHLRSRKAVNAQRSRILLPPPEIDMSYSTLLLHLDDDARARVRMEVATQIARRFSSRVVGLSCHRPAPWVGVPGAEFIGGDSLTAELAVAKQRSADREFDFLRKCGKAGLVSFEICATGDEVTLALAISSRSADLVILGQPAPEDHEFQSRRVVIDRVLEQTASPALIVPYAGQFESIGEIVLIAWNNGREAARAVADALPFLKRAKTVHLLTLHTSADKNGVADAERLDSVASWLTSHGVKARAKVEVTSVDVGNTLLSRAADLGADLLVMGAWSHSRLIERLVGGATRTVLDAMTVPVLMSH